MTAASGFCGRRVPPLTEVLDSYSGHNGGDYYTESLANFCTNITETDHALRQARLQMAIGGATVGSGRTLSPTCGAEDASTACYCCNSSTTMHTSFEDNSESLDACSWMAASANGQLGIGNCIDDFNSNEDEDEHSFWVSCCFNVLILRYGEFTFLSLAEQNMRLFQLTD